MYEGKHSEAGKALDSARHVFVSLKITGTELNLDKEQKVSSNHSTVMPFPPLSFLRTFSFLLITLPFGKLDSI